MEIWIILNPLIRFILYIAVFGSIGTFIFVLYFRDVLTTSQFSYCTTISQNFTKVIPTVCLAIFYLASFYLMTFDNSINLFLFINELD